MKCYFVTRDAYFDCLKITKAREHKSVLKLIENYFQKMYYNHIFITYLFYGFQARRLTAAYIQPTN